jgi:hypothetical protein
VDRKNPRVAHAVCPGTRSGVEGDTSYAYSAQKLAGLALARYRSDAQAGRDLSADLSAVAVATVEASAKAGRLRF